MGKLKLKWVMWRLNFSKASEEIKSLDENSREINNIMDEYRDILKLDGRVLAEDIKDYFKTAAYLKDEISQCNLLKKKLSSQFSALSESLNSINKVLNKFTDIRYQRFRGSKLR